MSLQIQFDQDTLRPIVQLAVAEALERMEERAKFIDEGGRVLLTKAEAARALGVSPSTLDRLRREAGLPAVKLDGLVLFRPASLDAWAAARETEGAAPALESLAHDDRMAGVAEANTAGRDLIEAGLAERGFEYAPSQANFIAMKVAGDTKEVGDALLKEGVIVRPMGSIIRVTVGTEEENHRFLKALDDVGVKP